MARVQVLRETTLDAQDLSDWSLWFQWCRYVYDDGNIECGYRFIWRRPQNEGGSLQAARGQARIPSVRVLEQLVARAKEEGWSHYDGDVEAAADRLRKSGLGFIVDVASGFVGWLNQDAAKNKAHLITPQMHADIRLIREHIGAPIRTEDDALPVAGSLAP